MANSTGTPEVRADEREWAQAGQWVNEAATCASDVTSCAGEAASHAVSAIGATASQKVDCLTAGAGSRIQALGDRIGQSTPQDGILGAAGQAVANSVRSGGQYLQDHKMSGMTGDVAELVRKNPLSAVVIALAVGWFVARRV